MESICLKSFTDSGETYKKPGDQWALKHKGCKKKKKSLYPDS